jgi:hypothetical protein
MSNDLLQSFSPLDYAPNFAAKGNFDHYVAARFTSISKIYLKFRLKICLKLTRVCDLVSMIKITSYGMLATA